MDSGSLPRCSVKLERISECPIRTRKPPAEIIVVLDLNVTEEPDEPSEVEDCDSCSDIFSYQDSLRDHIENLIDSLDTRSSVGDDIEADKELQQLRDDMETESTDINNSDTDTNETEGHTPPEHPHSSDTKTESQAHTPPEHPHSSDTKTESQARTPPEHLHTQTNGSSSPRSGHSDSPTGSRFEGDCHKEGLDVQTSEPGSENEARDSNFKKTIRRKTRRIKGGQKSSSKRVQNSKLSNDSERTFPCSICDEVFQSKHDVKKHSKSHKKNDSTTCPECGKVFKNKTGVMWHMRTHTGEKPYLCSECGRSFSQRGHLDRHLRVHQPRDERDRPFQCHTCGESFWDNQSLVRHSRKHTGEMPAKCSICGRGFHDQSTMRLHEVIHTGEKPHSCSVCGKNFAVPVYLTKHMTLVHNQNVKFKCSYCGKVCVSGWSLKVHERTHTGERLFQCTLCGKGYTSKKILEKHTRLHYIEEPQQNSGTAKKRAPRVPKIINIRPSLP